MKLDFGAWETKNPYRFLDNPDQVCITRTNFDYSKWTLMNYVSLIGSTRGELWNKLCRWSENKGIITDWDSHGVELYHNLCRNDASRPD